MELGKYRKFNLIIDEFQEFFYINESVFSEMQDVWDRYKAVSYTHLDVYKRQDDSGLKQYNNLKEKGYFNTILASSATVTIMTDSIKMDLSLIHI